MITMSVTNQSKLLLKHNITTSIYVQYYVQYTSKIIKSNAMKCIDYVQIGVKINR